MEVPKEVLERASRRVHERAEASRAWWRGMTEDERKAAYEAWLAANPDDFRAGWGYRMAAMSKNSIEAVWEHCTNKTTKQ